MNKKVSKFIIFLLIFEIIFSINNISNANTESSVFSVGEARGNNGDEVIISIDLNKSLNFVSANFVLEYDSTKLSYVTYTKGAVLETAAMCVVKNDSNAGKIAIGYVADPTVENQTKLPGNIMKVVFKINSTKAEEIDINLSCTDIKDDSGNNLEKTTKQGKIEVVNSGNSSQDIKEDSENTIHENQDNSINNTETLPKAGANNIISAIIVILIVISINLYIKYKKLEYIK